MVASTWRGRAEWATLVVVILAAGYFAQARTAAADDDDAAGEVVVVAKAERDHDGAAGEIVVVADVEIDGEATDGTKKAERKEVIVELRLDGKDIDVDVDSLPTSKAIKRIIKLSGDGVVELADKNEQQVAKLIGTVDVPSHYVGIHGGRVDPVLAKHLKLDEGEGVVVLLVVDDSPAAKAGVEKHDILVTANAKKIGNLTDVVDLIREGDGEEISLEVIREGEKMAITVKPEKRPENFGAVTANLFLGEGPEQQKDIQIWVEKLKKAGKDGVPHALRLRTLGPGMAFGGGSFGLGKMPENLSVNISKNDDEPAKITVKQGDRTWKFEADDKETMGELPDEIRAFIQPMLGHIGPHGAKANTFTVEIPEIRIPGSKGPKPDMHFGPRDELIERLEAMEKQLKEVHEEFQKLHAAEEAQKAETE